MQMAGAMSQQNACWCADSSDRLCVPAQAPAVAGDAAPQPDEPHAPAMAFNGDHIQLQQLQQQQHGPLIDAAEQVDPLCKPQSYLLTLASCASAGVGLTCPPLRQCINQDSGLPGKGMWRDCGILNGHTQGAAKPCVHLTQNQGRCQTPVHGRVRSRSDYGAALQGDGLPAGVLRETKKRRRLISAPTVPVQQPVQVRRSLW